MAKLFYRFEHSYYFTESEAWTIFKMAALAEACGWTLLITGIAIERYILPGSVVPVYIAGRFHGILFFMYALAAIGLYPTLRWSRKRAFVALLASVPPYGSLLFEQWAQYKRHRDDFTVYRYCLVLAALQESVSSPF